MGQLQSVLATKTKFTDAVNSLKNSQSSVSDTMNNFSTEQKSQLTAITKQYDSFDDFQKQATIDEMSMYNSLTISSKKYSNEASTKLSVLLNVLNQNLFPNTLNETGRTMMMSCNDVYRQVFLQVGGCMYDEANIDVDTCIQSATTSANWACTGCLLGGGSSE